MEVREDRKTLARDGWKRQEWNCESRSKRRNSTLINRPIHRLYPLEFNDTEVVDISKQIDGPLSDATTSDSQMTESLQMDEAPQSQME